ncbi:MAG: hypothetical protein RIA63_08120 [Cyclobacteriaceae bacterium]
MPLFKYSPFHAINFYPSIQLAFEYRVHTTSSVQLDFGYVYYNDNPNDFNNKNGLKVKLEYRYYLKKEEENNNHPYVSIEPYLNAVNFYREETEVECSDTDCQMQSLRSYRYLVQYREQGLSVKSGSVVSRWKNFVFDVNCGFTVRFVSYKPKTIEDLNTPRKILNGLFDFPNERNRIGFSPVIGLRIGCIIKK